MGLLVGDEGPGGHGLLLRRVHVVRIDQHVAGVFGILGRGGSGGFVILGRGGSRGFGILVHFEVLLLVFIDEFHLDVVVDGGVGVQGAVSRLLLAGLVGLGALLSLLCDLALVASLLVLLDVSEPGNRGNS